MEVGREGSLSIPDLSNTEAEGYIMVSGGGQYSFLWRKHCHAVISSSSSVRLECHKLVSCRGKGGE